MYPLCDLCVQVWLWGLCVCTCSEGLASLPRERRLSLEGAELLPELSLGAQSCPAAGTGEGEGPCWVLAVGWIS